MQRQWHDSTEMVWPAIQYHRIEKGVPAKHVPASSGLSVPYHGTRAAIGTLTLTPLRLSDMAVNDAYGLCCTLDHPVNCRRLFYCLNATALALVLVVVVVVVGGGA